MHGRHRPNLAPQYPNMNLFRICEFANMLQSATIGLSSLTTLTTSHAEQLHGSSSPIPSELEHLFSDKPCVTYLRIVVPVLLVRSAYANHPGKLFHHVSWRMIDDHEAKRNMNLGWPCNLAEPPSPLYHGFQEGWSRVHRVILFNCIPAWFSTGIRCLEIRQRQCAAQNTSLHVLMYPFVPVGSVS